MKVSVSTQNEAWMPAKGPSVEACSEMKIRVAWLHPTIPNYRLPLLQRLAQVPSLEVTSFHGPGREGISVRSVGTNLSVKNIWIRNYFWPLPGDRVLWQSALRELLRGAYDVIVCQEVIHNLTTWILLASKRIHKKKLILYGYGYRPENLTKGPKKLHNGIRKFLLESTDATIVYTERGRAECIQVGIEPSKVFVCGNTLDTEYLMSLEREVQISGEVDALRYHLNSLGHSVLLYVGRLVPEKRIDILLDAFRQLQSTTLSPRLLIVGEGAELQALLEHARGLEGVSFLGPIYDERELAKIFLVSDLLVIPGRVGLTCVHGFCYGVPVVTTAQGIEQSPEIDYVHHEENGYLVDELRAKLYTSVIMSLLNDRDKLNGMRKKARQTAQTLTMSHMASQFVCAVQYAMMRETCS